MSNVYNKVLVLGLGNPLMSDDGLGIHVVKGLKQKKWPPGIVILEVGTSVMNYLEEISQTLSLIAVDAVRAGGKPGSIYRLTLDELADAPGQFESHSFSLLQTIQLARLINGMPTDIVIYGMEPGQLGPGTQLSTAVQRTLPKMIDV
jgi:hydrogenase maturation protease